MASVPVVLGLMRKFPAMMVSIYQHTKVEVLQAAAASEPRAAAFAGQARSSARYSHYHQMFFTPRQQQLHFLFPLDSFVLVGYHTAA